MEPREKLELRKEITDEVKADLTRFAGKRITSRILLAMAVIGFELVIWTLIVLVATQKLSIGAGIYVSLFVCWMRVGQGGLINWFKEQ